MRPDTYPFLHFQIPAVLFNTNVTLSLSQDHYISSCFIFKHHHHSQQTFWRNTHNIESKSTATLSNAISTKSIMFQMSKTLQSVWTTDAESYDATSTITALEANPPSCTGIPNVSFMNEMSYHCRPSHHQTL